MSNNSKSLDKYLPLIIIALFPVFLCAVFIFYMAFQAMYGLAMDVSPRNISDNAKVFCAIVSVWLVIGVVYVLNIMRKMD